MGRKPLGDKAMTGAERLRRWRERKVAKADPQAAKGAPASQELIEARKTIAELRKQLADASKAAPQDSVALRLADELTSAEREVARLREQLAEARKSESEQVAALRQRNTDLEQARARRERAAEAAKAARAKAARAERNEEDDPRIKNLKTRNKNLTGELRRLREFYDEQLSTKGIMTFDGYGKVMKVLHSDSYPNGVENMTKAELVKLSTLMKEACGLVSQWKQGAAKARRQAR